MSYLLPSFSFTQVSVSFLYVRTNEKELLRGFSLDSGTSMAENPMYNTFRYALSDHSGHFLGSSVDFYADTVVTDAITRFHSPVIAIEGAIVLNLWMATVNKLYDGVRECKAVMNNPSLRNQAGHIHTIDTAAAYWIGAHEDLMYGVSEKFGKLFGQHDGNLSQVNNRVLSLLIQAQKLVSLSNSCSAEHPRGVVVWVYGTTLGGR